MKKCIIQNLIPGVYNLKGRHALGGWSQSTIPGDYRPFLEVWSL